MLNNRMHLITRRMQALSTPLHSLGQAPRSTLADQQAEAAIRIFQASNAFVGACQEATVALHALTAKIRAMEAPAVPVRKRKKSSTAHTAV
jgi:hypothetical protein